MTSLRKIVRKYIQTKMKVDAARDLLRHVLITSRRCRILDSDWSDDVENFLTAAALTVVQAAQQITGL